MGQYGLVMSISGLATQFSDFGINKTALRFASRAAASGDEHLQFAVLRWALRVRSALLILVSAAAFLTAPTIAGRYWHAGDLAPLVRFSLWVPFWAAVAVIPQLYFQSIRRFRVNTTVSSCQPVVFLLGIAALYALGRWGQAHGVWTVGNVIGVTIITTAAGAIAFLVIVPKAALFSVDDLRKPLREVLGGLWRAPAQDLEVSQSVDGTSPTRFTFLIGVSAAIAAVIQRVDVWMMGYFLAQSEIGVYQVALRLTLPITVLLGALNTALWPRASALTSPVQAVRLVRSTFAASALVTGVGLVYALLAPLLVPVLFGA